MRTGTHHATMPARRHGIPAMHEIDALRTLAVHAARHAYAPYSNLLVGTALRAASGKIYTGCNVENASFPIGSCAERGAIATAVQAEGAQFALVAIAVAAFNRAGEPLPVTPCGACRQALVEFGEEATVSFRQPDGHWLEVTASQLLPHRFSFPAG